MRLVTVLLFLPLALLSQPPNERSTIVTQKNSSAQIVGTTYAVIVAVDKYDTLPNLRFAVKDAMLFRNFLLSPAGGNVPAENIHCYFDSAANTGALTAGCVEWLNTRGVKEGDRVFFYLAGHGDEYKNEYFYFTWDAKLVTGRRNYQIQGNINIAQLKKSLLSYVTEDKAEVIFIIDACRVTAAADTTSAGMAKRLAHLAENDIIATKGFYSLYSTSGGSVAYESPSIGGGQGYFTYYLVEGGLGAADVEAMGNKDGRINLNEFASYPKKMVPVATVAQLKLAENQGQVPEFTGQAAEKTILFKVDEKYLADRNGDNIYNLLSKRGSSQDAITMVAMSRNASDLQERGVVTAFNNFLTQLRSKQLVNGTQSALSSYLQMKKQWPQNSIAEEARLLLISELINFSKNVVDLYLIGADSKMVEAKAASNDVNAGFYKELVRASTADFATAAAHVEKAIELLSNDNPLVEQLQPRLWFLQARSYLDGNRKYTLEDAIGLAEKALAKDTNAVHLFHLLAILEVRRNNIPKAEAYFIKAMEGETSYSKNALELGYYFFKLRRFDEASIYYRMRRIDDQQFAAAYNTLALNALQAGSDKQAERFFRKAITLDTAEYLQRNLSIYYRKKAETAASANKWLEAEYYHTLSVQAMPRSVNALINLANFYSGVQVKQYSKARDNYQAALKLDPKNVLVLHNFAILYFNNGLLNKNRNFLDSAISLSKKLIEYDKAGTYTNAATQRIANATAVSAKFQPANAPLQNLVNAAMQIDTTGNSLIVARKLMEVKQLDQAERFLTALLVKEPANVDALLTFSELYMEKEQVGNAIKQLERAWSLNKNNIKLAIDLADAYIQNSETQKAKRLLAPLLQSDPYNPTLVLWLGYANEQEQNISGAEAIYTSFYYRNPKNREVLERLYEVSLHLGKSGAAEKYRRELIGL